jgi:hypothetical protein
MVEARDSIRSGDSHGWDKPPHDPLHPEITSQQLYNIATDIGTGVNYRVRDNIIQASIIAVCFLLGIGIGCLVITDRITGGVLGGFIGLLVGLFGSGFVIMVYRGWRHTQGKHD